MSYPAAVAAGNDVIAAAVEWEEAGRDLNRARSARSKARMRLRDAVERYREATTREHVQGPDIDARYCEEAPA